MQNNGVNEARDIANVYAISAIEPGERKNLLKFSTATLSDLETRRHFQPR
jgi:hypothetical protein